MLRFVTFLYYKNVTKRVFAGAGSVSVIDGYIPTNSIQKLNIPFPIHPPPGPPPAPTGFPPAPTGTPPAPTGTPPAPMGIPPAPTGIAPEGARRPRAGPGGRARGPVGPRGPNHKK